MTPLSKEDEEKCAIYVSGIINKFNKKQHRGIVPVVMASESEQESSLNNDESQDGNNTPLPPTNVNGPTADGGESNLTEVVGIYGASFSYKGSKVTSDYGAEGGFLISPQTGNSFVPVTFTVTNVSEGDVNLDIKSRSLNFTAKLTAETDSGPQEITSAVDMTILPDNLNTYTGNLPAGESIDLTIIFQFPTAYVSDLSSLTLTAYKDGTRYEIPFN